MKGPQFLHAGGRASMGEDRVLGRTDSVIEELELVKQPDITSAPVEIQQEYTISVWGEYPDGSIIEFYRIVP